MKEIKRGEIWEANINPTYNGSIQAGKRPVVIISNNIGNKYSPCLLVAVVTSKIKHNLPTHFNIKLRKESTVLCEQLFTINKKDLVKYVRKLDENETKELDKALSIALGLDENYK